MISSRVAGEMRFKSDANVVVTTRIFYHHVSLIDLIVLIMSCMSGWREKPYSSTRVGMRLINTVCSINTPEYGGHVLP